MTGETGASESGWTVDTLKVLIEQHFTDLEGRLLERQRAQEIALETSLTAAQTAVDKAEVAASKRFDSTNEFRGQLADQAKMFVTKDEYVASHRGIDAKIADLQKRADMLAGRTTGLSAGWAYLVGGVALIATILSIAFTVINRAS